MTEAAADGASPDALVVGEGLFEAPTTPGGHPSLLGCRCELCGEVVFPRMQDCPACVSYGSMRPVRLRGEGTVRDFIVTRRGPEGFPVPYIQANVQLADGPLIYSMIDGCAAEDDALVEGQEVVMTIEPVRWEGDRPVIGWKFRPKAPTP
jgi:uncharacterized OB-fold protein